MSELQRSLTLSRLFSWSDARHYSQHACGEYEVCRRLLWWPENLLWYGGAVLAGEEAGR